MTEAAAAPLNGVRLALAAIALALANFIVILDTTITNVSVPHIAGGLAIAPSQGTWTITSYAIAEAITVPLTGWLINRFGAYRLLLCSLIGFALFSFLCGVAQTIELLVVFRIMQGLCGGPLMPLTQTFLMRIFPPEKMATAMALWGVTTISAPIVGPIIGGFISDNWSWPWIFFINLPIIAGCIYLVMDLIARYETETRRERIDVVGLVLLIVAVSGFQLMLDLGREHDWYESPMILAFGIVAAISFTAFIIWEWHDPNPVVNLHIFKHRSFSIGMIGIALGFGGMFASIVMIPLWLQNVVGYTSSEAGYTVALVGVFAVVMSPVLGSILNRGDMRLPIFLGMLWVGCMSVMRMHWTADADFWTYALPQLLQGFGMPFFFMGLMSLAMSSIPPRDTASAAGLLSFMRTVSGAIGTAIATAYWDSSTRASRSELAQNLNNAENTMAQMQANGMSADQSRVVLERLVEAQAATIAVNHVFTVAAIILILSAFLVWLAPKPREGSFMIGGGH